MQLEALAGVVAVDYRGALVAGEEGLVFIPKLVGEEVGLVCLLC